MRRPHARSIVVLLAILLVGSVTAVAISYRGGTTGSAVSPLPTDTPEPPTDTPVPIEPTDTPIPPEAPTDTPVPVAPTDTPIPPEAPTDTPVSVEPTDTPIPPTPASSSVVTPSVPSPSPTAASSYRVHIEVKWYDATGSLLSEPPVSLPADFHVTAQSELGTATCVYSAGSTGLDCQYSNQGAAGEGDGLKVPPGTMYTVSESGLPVGWRSFAGIGMFPGGGPSPSYVHVVDNRAPGAPPPSPTPIPTPTPKPPKPKPPTPEPAEPTATPVPPTPTFTPVPPTPTPLRPTATPTSTPEPPTPTPDPTPTPESPTPTPLEPSPSPLPPSHTPVEVAEAGNEPVSTSTTREGTPPGDGADTLSCLCGMLIAAGLIIGLVLLFFWAKRRKRSEQ